MTFGFFPSTSSPELRDHHPLRLADLQGYVSLPRVEKVECCWEATYQIAVASVPSDSIGSQVLQYTWRYRVISNLIPIPETKAILPFGRSALLLNLSKDAFCLVVDAMGASRHLAVALDLLFPTHVASLSSLNQRPTSQDPRLRQDISYPSNSPSLWIIGVVE